MTDIEIARGTKLEKIVKIAEKYGIEEDDLEVYGKYKAKLTKEFIKKQENKTEVPEQGKVYEENSDVGTTDKKQQAIALVKDKWGEDSTVTFRCDSITNDGEYIIAVVSSQTASVKNYFKVNLDTKTVEVDY